MVRAAHDGAITALEWIPGQPVLVTSGEDNSVKASGSRPFNAHTFDAARIAMAFRLADSSSSITEIQIGTPLTPASYPLLWRRWKAALDSLSRSQFTVYLSCARLAIIRVIAR